MDIRKSLEKRILILDGAMGTMIQQYNLSEQDFRGESFQAHTADVKGVNDLLSITRPDLIRDIHTAYLEAGADIITTNSFNANYFGLKAHQLEDRVYEINYAAADIARNAASSYMQSTPGREIFVAGTMGPTIKSASITPDINHPAQREVTFDELTRVYTTQAKGLIEGGVDLILVETVFDTLNAKAALYAVNQVKKSLGISIPVMVSGTIDESGRNLSGQTVEAFFNSLEPFNLFSIGLNCSFGADRLIPYLERLAIKSTIHVSAHPNAGLPNEMGNYDQSAIEMAQQIGKYLEQGLINIVGGCCGTTPEHVKAIKRVAGKYNPRVIMPHIRTTRLSGLQSLGVKEATRLIQIGERTTVSGSARFKRCIENEQYDKALEIAHQQIEAGADLLNISLDDGLIDTPRIMPHFLNLLSSEPDLASAPFMIDSSSFEVLESSLKILQGRAIVNSISLKDGEELFLQQAKKLSDLGANVVVMAFDEKGQGDTYERKIEICARAYELWTRKMNLPPENLIFDPNVLAIGTGMEEHNHYGKDFIRAVQWIKQNLPFSKVMGGITNVSFAFRGNDYLRRVIHSVFLHHCVNAGLDFAIVNPGKTYDFDKIPERLRRSVEDLVFNLRRDATDQLLKIAPRYSRKEERDTLALKWRKQPAKQRMKYALEKGISSYLEEDMQELRNEVDHPLELVEGPLMEAMNRVGELFGKGEMFLPQVIKSARIMNEAVDLILPEISEHQEKSNQVAARKKVLLATVNGDVHDIGKNIFSLVLESNHFQVLDLGVMVSKEDILEHTLRESPDIIALSGLITPSLNQMTQVITLLEEKGIQIPVMIGGATTSALHTAMKMAPLYSGAVVYSADASKGVSIASKLVSDRSALFIEEIQDGQKKLRESRLKRTGKKRLSFRDARRKRYMYNYGKEKPVKPRLMGTKIFEDFDLKLLQKYIDWTPFFHGWGLKGVFPQIFEKEKVGKEAKRVFDEAQVMLNEIIQEKLIKPKGIIGLYPANSDGDDVLIFKSEARRKIIKRIPMLRQQQLRDQNGLALSLSDYIAPVDSGIKDYFGGFAVTTGIGSDQHVERFKQKGDSYNSIMFRLIADRMVEAFAEVLHEWVRKKYWGYEPHEDLTKEELIKEKYQGIRPAPGYPACPDHSLKKHLFELMDVEEKVGITLTESFAMRPASSVSGFYMAHNASKYFGVGKIGKDQLRDYARRAKIEVKEAEKWLGAVIDDKS